MKYYISISGEFDEDLFNKFLQDWHAAPADTEEIDIFLNTSGGNDDVCSKLLDIIHHSVLKITLIATDQIYSAGFELFFKANVNRRILPFTLGMTHHATSDSITINAKGGVNNICDKAMLDCLKSMKNDSIELCKTLGMNDNEIKKVKQGKDVYFQTPRLQEFLDHISKTA